MTPLADARVRSYHAYTGAAGVEPARSPDPAPGGRSSVGPGQGFVRVGGAGYVFHPVTPPLRVSERPVTPLYHRGRVYGWHPVVES